MSPVAKTAAEPKTFSVEDLRKPFQKAVAGTFYRTMMKAVRSTEHKTPYLNGGASEDIFKSQLDDRLADTFAESHGEMFSKPLFEHLAQQLTGRIASPEKSAGPAKSDDSAQPSKSLFSSLAPSPSHVNALA